MRDKYQDFKYNWKQFRAMFRLLNRKAELKRLEKWSRRNKYIGPLRLYRSCIQETEFILMKLGMKNPRMLRRTRILHFLGHLITTAPKYPKKGMASHYRYRNNLSRNSRLSYN